MEAVIAQRKSCGFSLVEYHSRDLCGSSRVDLVNTELGIEQDPPRYQKLPQKGVPEVVP
jgi:hypothetical protein